MRLDGKTIAALLTVVGLLGVLATIVIEPRIQANRAALLGKGDYRLEMTDGRPFTRDTLTEGPSAVFFGFTHCPDICPTTMGDIAMWKDSLPAAEDLNVYFLTVDPQRDTAEHLAAYTSWIPDVHGVTGSMEEMAKAVRSFDIYAARVDFAGGGYTMSHTSYVMLFDENGMFVETIPYQSAPDVAVEKIANLMTGNPAQRGARMPDDLLDRICYNILGEMI